MLVFNQHNLLTLLSLKNFVPLNLLEDARGVLVFVPKMLFHRTQEQISQDIITYLITIFQNRIQRRHFLKDEANAFKVHNLPVGNPDIWGSSGRYLQQCHLTHFTKFVFTMGQSQRFSRSCLSQAQIRYKENVRQGCNLPKYQVLRPLL